MPRFAANLTMMFNEVPFPDRFARAAASGFKAVEFLSPYDHAPADIAFWLESAGLESVLFNMALGNWAAGERGISALPGREADFRAGVALALDYAQALGTKHLHAMAGQVPDGTDLGSCHATFVDNLRYAAQELAKHGRTVVIEPINHRDMPRYFLNTQAQAQAILDEVALPNVKLQMDFYHMQITEGDLAMRLRRHFGAVGHVQIAGVPERQEPDIGEINHPYLFTLLDDLGYDGWVGCEYRPRGQTEAGLGWLAAVASPAA
jgi:hydroxypyruvate isomerase